jgi:hypothetical protein
MSTENNKFLTHEQSKKWLISLRSLDKTQQWTAIKERLFSAENNNSSVDSVFYSPLLVINGVPWSIPDKLRHKNRADILGLLTEDSIEEIVILDKIGGIFCRPDAGVISLIVDKKTNRKLFKLKLG